MSGAEIRLNRLLAERGVASRRRADDLIRRGLVAVEGRVVREVGTRVPSDARVQVGGKQTLLGSRAYFVLNKPPGVVCTSAPDEPRPRAIDLVKAPGGSRLYCVGRLDLDSRGLVLLTNDGEFAARVLHPRYGVPRTYWVRLKGRIDGSAIGTLARGVHLAEGRTGPILVRALRRTRDWSVCTVTVREGMNRELRRAFARVGFSVLELTRTRIGPVSIRGLRPGESRRLTRAEVEGLRGPLIATVPGAAIVPRGARRAGARSGPGDRR